MSTVHQAQRAIQSLLGNSDYVGALDLISTTQDVLIKVQKVSLIKNSSEMYS